MEKMSKYQQFHEESGLFLRYKVHNFFLKREKLKDKPQLTQLVQLYYK
jgi:hypothetical protein